MLYYDKWNSSLGTKEESTAVSAGIFPSTLIIIIINLFINQYK